MDRAWHETIHQGDFDAEASVQGEHMEVCLVGTADQTVKNRFDHFLHDLHAQAQKHDLGEVRIDLRRLEYMDSSCLKTLAWWIGAVQEQAPDRRYRIVFLSSPTVYWQRQSLNTLGTLASGLVAVEH